MAKKKSPAGDTDRWQLDHIRQGMHEADAAKFVPQSEVRKVLARLRGQ